VVTVAECIDLAGWRQLLLRRPVAFQGCRMALPPVGVFHHLPVAFLSLLHPALAVGSGALLHDPVATIADLPVRRRGFPVLAVEVRFRAILAGVIVDHFGTILDQPILFFAIDLLLHNPVAALADLPIGRHGLPVPPVLVAGRSGAIDASSVRFFMVRCHFMADAVTAPVT